MYLYKLIFVLSFFLLLQTNTQAQIVNIPDANFKAALLAHGTTITGQGISIIDTDGDGEIQVSEAQAYSGGIYLPTGTFANNITGIELFVALTGLDISRNPLSSLDVSNNVALTSLSIENCQMGSLDVSNNVNLVTLRCRNIGISTLDLSQNTALDYLYCPYNQWVNLDVSNNIALTYLDCSENPLTSLDLSNNIALTYLNCSKSPLTSLDVSNNIALRSLISSEVPLTSLDVSNNTLLTHIVITGTPLGSLSSLDVSNNIVLKSLSCITRQLNGLDLSNNTALDTLSLWAKMPNLDLSNNILLKYLIISDYGNQMNNVDVSSNIDLRYLGIRAPQLTHLDLSNNLNLDILGIARTQITRLDLSKHGGLSNFNIRESLPFLQICVPSIINALNNPNWTKDSTGSYVEGCPNALAIEGSITIDDNNNCQTDPSEVGLENALLLFENGIDSTYALTNSLGDYQAYLDTGIHTTTVLPTHPYWSACPNSQQVTVDTNYQIQTIDFSLQATTICPYLEVEIATPLLRRCFNSTYYVDYCNSGTLVANNAYIEVELDTNLYFNSSSISLSSQTGNLYRFNIGNLPVDSCGRFSIDVTVSCASELGQIHCASAHIHPNILCSWNLPNLQLTDTCLVDTVSFTVLNHANVINLPYLLLEDSVVVDTGSFILNNGQFASILYPTGGGASTYQLVVANGNPTYYTASGLVGCDTNSASTDLLYLPNLPQDFADIDCTPNRGSYDPNDKTGYPLGYTNNHYIQPNSTIDYRIRFQNTGTDTAIFINILDTISPYLDLSTLNMGVASHAYTLQIMPSTPSGQQVLRFQFNPIYLPDSNANEPASNGFIQYNIAQQANLPNGTIINNSASIYFDYNAPVKTNTTLYTVCDDCYPKNITNLGSSTINLTKIDLPNYEVSVIPNPFSTETRIEIKGYNQEGTSLKLEVYDVMGRLQTTLNGNQNGQFLLQRGEMPVGIYFFRISERGKLLQSGRLMVGE